MQKPDVPSPSEELLFTLSHYFDYAGMNNPFSKVYLTAKFRDDFATILFVFVIAHLQKSILPKNSGIFILRELKLI